jgi:hypothetical protein
MNRRITINPAKIHSQHLENISLTEEILRIGLCEIRKRTANISRMVAILNLLIIQCVSDIERLIWTCLWLCPKYVENIHILFQCTFSYWLKQRVMNLNEFEIINLLVILTNLFLQSMLKTKPMQVQINFWMSENVDESTSFDTIKQSILQRRKIFLLFIKHSLTFNDDSLSCMQFHILKTSPNIYFKNWCYQFVSSKLNLFLPMFHSLGCS